jgi:hypothetical protein
MAATVKWPLTEAHKPEAEADDGLIEQLMRSAPNKETKPS